MSVPLLHPWASDPEERDGIVASARLLVGNSIETVTYVELSYVPEAEYVNTDAFDAVTMGIEFGMSDGQKVAAAWVIGGYVEQEPQIVGDTNGLSLGRGSVRERLGPLDAQYRDVSSLSNWTTRIKSRICDVHCVFGNVVYQHRPVQTLWSVRVDFESAPSAVIALGGPAGDDREGPLQYEPKGVVVIFDESTARKFRVQDLSAWGE